MMQKLALSALLRQTRSAAQAVALPSLLVVGATSAVFMPTHAEAAPISTAACTAFANGTTDCVNPTQLGDKNLTFLGFSLDPVGSSRNVAVSYEWSDFDGIADQDFSDDLWTFSAKNVAGEPAFSGPFTLTYSYQVDIVSGPDSNGFIANGDPWFFNAFGVDTDVPPLTQQVTAIKDVDTEAELLKLASSNGTPDGPAIFAGDFKSVIVKDTITVNSTGSVFSVTNAWNQRKVAPVPGPLPILGAAAAFSFSRRMRRRIAAVQPA